MGIKAGTISLLDYDRIETNVAVQVSLRKIQSPLEDARSSITVSILI